MGIVDCNGSTEVVRLETFAMGAGGCEIFHGAQEVRQLPGFQRAGAGSGGKFFQGPVADALSHIGQIAILRRMARAPVKGENYYVAEIEAGRVGADQVKPKREF